VLDFIKFFGGADGTRTRDPRRDRNGIEVNVYAGFQPNRIPKNVKNVSISCGFAGFYSKVFLDNFGARPLSRNSSVSIWFSLVNDDDASGF